jgi:hypothetical protein
MMFVLSRTELAAPRKAPSNGGDGGGSAPKPSKPAPNKQPQSQQCSAILNDFNSKTDALNGTAWTKFYGGILVGWWAGGPKGATAAAFEGVVNDTSRSDINNAYSQSNAQWHQAGCPGNMPNKWQ